MEILKYLFVVVSLSILLPANTLILHLSNSDELNSTQVEIPSFYTTLGPPPSHNILTNITFLSAHNFSEDCRFSPSTNISSLQNKFVVIESFPKWFKCVSFYHGVKTAMGRLLQRVGVRGVLLASTEHVCLYYSKQVI